MTLTITYMTIQVDVKVDVEGFLAFAVLRHLNSRL